MDQIKSGESAYDKLCARLQTERHTWLVTGVAGFIGSNLLETLLKLNQRVVGLDNFATGHQRNLDEVQTLVTSGQWANFHFIEGDIRKLEDCRRAMVFPQKDDVSEEGAGRVEYVLHEAALGSVPRSLTDPIATNEVNISGFLNMLVAARDASVDSFTYAASSSTYGDHPGLPKVEHIIGKPLSPYAVTKHVNELYADVFARCYGFNTIGLRYFNVFGPRQDPDGAYAAVIPKWIASLIRGESVYINGDGSASRDYCYVENAIQANLLAAIYYNRNNSSQIYNVAVGNRTTLNELLNIIQSAIKKYGFNNNSKPIYRSERAGDVKHSQANITKAINSLGYCPEYSLVEGVSIAAKWYFSQFG